MRHNSILQQTKKSVKFGTHFTRDRKKFTPALLARWNLFPSLVKGVLLRLKGILSPLHVWGCYLLLPWVKGVTSSLPESRVSFPHSLSQGCPFLTPSVKGVLLRLKGIMSPLHVWGCSLLLPWVKGVLSSIPESRVSFPHSLSQGCPVEAQGYPVPTPCLRVFSSPSLSQGCTFQTPWVKGVLFLLLVHGCPVLPFCVKGVLSSLPVLRTSYLPLCLKAGLVSLPVLGCPVLTTCVDGVLSMLSVLWVSCPVLTPFVQVRGYQIFCGERLVQRVRSASRTKALLHGVALAEPTTFRIHSVKDGEVLSPPVEVCFLELLFSENQKHFFAGALHPKHGSAQGEKDQPSAGGVKLLKHGQSVLQ